MAFLDKTGLEHLWAQIISKLGKKVDKEDGKGLSTNDYTTDEKTKLSGIEEGATKVTVDSDLSSTSTNPVQNKAVNTAISHLNALVGDTTVSEQIASAITAQKGTENGIAELDENGKVPSAQLPSYVDDVLEYDSEANFPTTGEAGKIYVDISANITYRWTGSTYVEIGSSLALGENSSTAFRGDYGKIAYDHATAKGSAFSSGLYKITTNDQGHVTAATAVAKDDITGLGIPAQDTTYSTATTSANGLMSSTDKTKLDGIETGANKTTVDSELSSTSTNPVQNNVVNTAISNLSTLIGDTSVSDQISSALSSMTGKGNSIPFVTAVYSSADSDFTYYTATVDEWSDATTKDDLEGRIAYIKLDTDAETSAIMISFNGYSNIMVVRRTSGDTGAFTAYFNSNLKSGVPFLGLIGKVDAISSYSLRCIAIDQGTRAYGASDFSKPVNINKGGTGATTAAEALTNLGLTATATELNYCDGVTSNIQAQLDAKAESSHGIHVTYGTSAAALGTSSAGSASTVSRSDHVHALPALTSCTGTLTVEKGGTGAMSAEAARSNLGVPLYEKYDSGNFKFGAGDVSAWAIYYGDDGTIYNQMDLGQDTTYFKKPVTVASGGTGATSKSDARTNLGITSGTSLPSTGSTGDIFFLY